MCNCGKNRNTLKQQNVAAAGNANLKQQNAPVQNMQATQTVLFQYTGNTALSVIGNLTRNTYRFSFPGDVQPIALTDAAAMAAVPVLKRM